MSASRPEGAEELACRRCAHGEVRRCRPGETKADADAWCVALRVAPGREALLKELLEVERGVIYCAEYGEWLYPHDTAWIHGDDMGNPCEGWSER